MLYKTLNPLLCFVSVFRVNRAWATKILEVSTFRRFERRLRLVFYV